MGTTLIEERKNGKCLTDLPTQQQTFLLSLMGSLLFSPTDAAREAGYKNPSQAAYRLLQKPAIQAILGKMLRQRREMMEHTNEEVLRELDYIAFRDPIALCQDGILITDDLRKVPPEMRRCIDGIELEWKPVQVGRGKSKKFIVKPFMKLRMVSKEAALTLMMKHRGMLKPNETNVTLNLGLVQQVLGERVHVGGKPDLIEQEIEEKRRVVDGKP
jgi:phage terminase small subunit